MFEKTLRFDIKSHILLFRIFQIYKQKSGRKEARNEKRRRREGEEKEKRRREEERRRVRVRV